MLGVMCYMLRDAWHCFLKSVIIKVVDNLEFNVLYIIFLN